MRTTALLLACSLVLSASAQERPRTFGAHSFVTAIELMVEVSDSAGKTPPDLTPADFIVREDGVERKIIAVDYLGAGTPQAIAADAAQAPQIVQRVEAPWQTVIWFDAITSSRQMLHDSVRDLKARAPELVAMGPVTVFYGDLKPRAVITGTSDANALRSALDGMLTKLGAVERIKALRRQFMRELSQDAYIRGEYLNTGAHSIGYYVAEERRLARTARTNLTRWLGRMPRQQPRMLLYVSGGFDLDPAAFYYEMIRVNTPIPRSDNHKDNMSPGNEAFARTLSAEGWVVVAVGGTGGFEFISNVEVGGMPGRDPRAKAAEMTFILYAPQEPLEQYARETGGVRVVHGGHLPGVLDRMRNRVRITYQVDREPDVEPRKVAVESRRQGLKVKAPRWSSSSSSSALMEVRALELLETPGTAERGDLLLAAYAVPEDAKKKGERAGVLKVRVDLRPLQEVAEQIGATKVRFTVGFSDHDKLPSFSPHVVDAPSLAGVDELEWSIPYRLPEGAERASIVAQELSTGAWGAVRVPLDGKMATSEMPETPEEPPPAGWFTDERAARLRALAEGKGVFVYQRDPRCRACRKLLEEAETHPTLQRLASGFVLLLTGEPSYVPKSTTSTNRDRQLARLRPATFGLMDATGVEVMTWPASDRRGQPLPIGIMLEALQRAQAAAPHVLQAAEERAAGKAYDAYLSTAMAFRQAGERERAVEAYDAAIRTAREAGNTSAAQSAEILLTMTEAAKGKLEPAIAALRKIAAAPVTPRNEGEAWLALGQLLRASGDEREAVQALDRAARLAAASSNVGQTAQTLLETPERVVGSDTALVRVLVPNRASYSGTINAQALARDPSITSVVFSLDGVEIANDTEPPFETPADLGPVPRRHELRVIARDAEARTVGHDTLVLNDRHDEFWVRLALGERRTAAASVNLPSGGTLAGVEFFLDERSIGRRTSPPFTASIGQASEGTLRVAATLTDGRVAEDALLVGGSAELVEVREVEVYATVHDARGALVPNLNRTRFTVLEEGQPRRITGFDTPGQAPFTAGLAIDSSSSMLVRMADIHASARTFLESTVRDGNHAFVVDFDRTPKLAATTTSDAAALRRGIETIRADGSTALYDAMVFSLLQLQGASGKRALIVLSDGRDEGSRYKIDDVARVARESGAAIYLVVFTRAAPARLNALASESGGRLWEVMDTKQLDGIYAEIERELRAQYRLSFRTDARASDGWRRVEVKVDAANAKVRSASGFAPR